MAETWNTMFRPPRTSTYAATPGLPRTTVTSGVVPSTSSNTGPTPPVGGTVANVGSPTQNQMFSFGTNPPQPRIAEMSAEAANWSGNATAEDREAEAIRKERALEAERLWWSEASERQVKELETSFGHEFEKTAAKLRADIESSQDKLEMLVESERNQRHAALMDLRRELDAQKVMLTEVVRQLEASLRSKAAGVEPALEETTHSGSSSVRGGAGSASATASSVAVGVQRGDWERQKDLQLAGLEAAVSDLRHELMGLERGATPMAASCSQDVPELEMLVRGLRTELEALKDRTELQGQSQQELHTLHSVITQSIEELSRGLHEVSNTAAASEYRLKQSLVEARAETEASSRTQIDQVLQVLEASGSQLAQGLVDERERRTTEANVLRARLDAISGQFEDLDKTLAAAKLPSAAPPSLEHLAPLAEVEKLAASLETTRSELSRLEKGVGQTEALQGALAEAKRLTESRAQELGAGLREGLGAAEERILRQLAEGLAGERSWCAEQMAGLWRHADEVALNGERPAAGQAQQPGQEELPGLDLPRLKAELQSLREAIQTVQTQQRQAAANSEVSSVPFLKSAGLALGTRVDLLQEQLRSHITAQASRLDALDTKVQQAARTSDVRRMEEEVQRMEQQELRPLVRRVEAAEAEGKRVTRELRPLEARCEAMESELQRLVRDSAPLVADLRTLQPDPDRMEGSPATSAQTAAPQEPSAEEPMPPGLSNELQASVGSLLQRVHLTLTGARAPAQEAAAPSVDMHSARPLPPGLNGSDGQVRNDADLMQAMQAVQELRQRNLALREENAGLVEEILAQQQELSPESKSSASLRGLRWTPSAQQSACTTPGDAAHSTAQFVGCGAGPAGPTTGSAPAAAPLPAAASPAVGGGPKRPEEQSPQLAGPLLASPAWARPLGPAVGPSAAAAGQVSASPPRRSLASSVALSAAPTRSAQATSPLKRPQASPEMELDRRMSSPNTLTREVGAAGQGGEAAGPRLVAGSGAGAGGAGAAQLNNFRHSSSPPARAGRASRSAEGSIILPKGAARNPPGMQVPVGGAGSALVPVGGAGSALVPGGSVLQPPARQRLPVAAGLASPPPNASNDRGSGGGSGGARPVMGRFRQFQEAM